MIVLRLFRVLSQSIYDLDPPHFMLLLSLFIDPELYLFSENNIRGRISIISHRLADANNQYTDGKFDDTSDPSYLFYVDANNLYGYAQVICFNSLQIICIKLFFLSITWMSVAAFNLLHKNDFKRMLSSMSATATVTKLIFVYPA